MGRSAEITLEFGGEERVFRFLIAEHKRLQEALDVGVSDILEALHPCASYLAEGASLGQVMEAGRLGRLRLDHIREVIFQGLIGGGMTPNEAGRLCKSYVLERPVLESVPTAYAIGIAVMIGAPDEVAAGEQAGEGDPLSPAANSDSAKMASMPSAPPAASPPASSTP